MYESYRRLSKNYERSPKFIITLIYTTIIHIELKDWIVSTNLSVNDEEYLKNLKNNKNQ